MRERPHQYMYLAELSRPGEPYWRPVLEHLYSYPVRTEHMRYAIRVTRKSWGVDDKGQVAGGTQEEMHRLLAKWQEHDSKLDISPEDVSYEVVADEPAQLRLPDPTWPIGTNVWVTSTGFEGRKPGIVTAWDTSVDGYTAVKIEGFNEGRNVLFPDRCVTQRLDDPQNIVWPIGTKVWVEWPRDKTRTRGVVLTPSEEDPIGYSRVLCENKSNPIPVANERLAKRTSENDPLPTWTSDTWPVGTKVWVTQRAESSSESWQMRSEAVIAQEADGRVPPGCVRVLMKGWGMIFGHEAVTLRTEEEQAPQSPPSPGHVLVKMQTVWVVEEPCGGGYYRTKEICKTFEEAERVIKTVAAQLYTTERELRIQPHDALVCGDKVMLIETERFWRKDE